MKSRGALLFVVCTWLILWPVLLNAAGEENRFVIRSVSFDGIRQTRPSVLTRELIFREGDTLSASTLGAALEQSRKNIVNTSLFTTVRIDSTGSEGEPRPLDVIVRVIERWYIWPIPYLEFPYQNLNSWLKNPLVSHLTYGVNLAFNNARGRNETLTILLFFGYNKQFGFTYRMPAINKKKTWGVGFGASAAFNRTLVVAVEDNQSVYATLEEGALRQHYAAFGEVHFRPAWYLFHTLTLGYDHYIFNDTLRQIDGYFTADTSLTRGFFSLAYKGKFDKRDDKAYPLRGYYADLILTQQGIPGGSTDLFSASASLRGYWKLARRWYAGSGLTVLTSAPADQPFFLQQGLGAGRDFIRGYDSYLIPGQHFLTAKNNIKFALVPPRVMNLSFLTDKKFSVVPYALYISLFGDLGYVWNNDPAQSAANSLTNSFLLGYGVEFDFTSYYDIVLGVGFSYTIQKTPGLFFHLIAPI